MKKAIKLILTILLAIGLIYCGVRCVEYVLGDRTYDLARRNGGVPDLTEVEAATGEGEEYVDPYVELLEEIDLDALRETNEDVLGWICIPGTEVDYPLMYSETNKYYLGRTWTKKNLSIGSVFLECENSTDFSDYNTIIYGHNMTDGSMFGNIDKFKNYDYWKEHPSIYVVTDDGVQRYDIFGCFRSNKNSMTYGMRMLTEKRRNEFVQRAVNNTLLDTGFIPQTSDHFLTLSTCSYSGSIRWVVQAVEAEGAPYWLADDYVAPDSSKS